MSTVERFEVRSFAPDERPEAWRSVLAETHLMWDTGPEVTTSRRQDGWVERTRLGDAAIVDCGCAPCGGRRGARGRSRARTARSWAS